MLFVYCVRTDDIHVYTVYGHCLYLYSFACLHNKSSVGVNCFSSSSVILGRNPPSIAAACDIVFPDLATGTGSLLSNECSLWYPDRSCCSKPLTNLPMASSISAASGLASIKSASSGQGMPPSPSSTTGEGTSLCSAALCWPRNPVYNKINSVNTCKYIVYACLVLVCTLSVHAHTVYIGLHNLKPHWLCIYIACTMVIHVYTLYVHVMYMFYDLHTVHRHHIYYFLPFCPMLVDRNLQFCTLTV